MNVAIITGGRSEECAVALRSSEFIYACCSSWTEKCKVYIFPADIPLFLEEYDSFDCVIPAIHGKDGEDGALQGFLEILSIPYIFSSIQTHSIGINKVRTKQILDNFVTITPTLDLAKPSFPCFVKPITGGSSIKSGTCNSQEELTTLTQGDIASYIAEEYIKGREFTVGVIEKDDTTEALPVCEIISDTFFDYDSKYNPEKLATEICPAHIDEALKNTLQSHALIAHQILECRHISRSDFIVDPSGVPYFLEINTIPGMTQTSFIPQMLNVAHIDPVELFKSWCEESVHRRGYSC